MANDKRTIYVGGLSEEVSEKLIEQAFIPFGDITEIQLPQDYETQKHRGKFLWILTIFYLLYNTEDRLIQHKKIPFLIVRFLFR